MRLDDCLPASGASEEEGPVAAAQPRSTASGLRFTSNVVGSLYVVTDVICFIVGGSHHAWGLFDGSRLAARTFRPYHRVHLDAGQLPAHPLVASGVSAQSARS